MNHLTPTIGQTYSTIEIDGVSIFYREAGSPDDPTILLLHGFPTSSFMYRDLIPALADEYHLIAPDYPGFGYSEQPPLDEFDYSFEHFTELMDTFTQELGLTEYSPYVMDYGAPVGFRLASDHPERVQALLVQNGNAYKEGLVPEFWDPVKEYWANPSEETLEPLRGFTSPEEVEWQYTHGVRNEAAISPDTWTLDRVHLDRPENESIQFQLLLDYRTNLSLYPDWQEYFREHQPPTLVVWGEHDKIFDVAGAAPYAEDLETAEIHRLDTGHFALEEDSEEIATLIREFLADHIAAH